MLEYQKSPAPHTACRVALVFVFATSNTEHRSEPESGAATARFLVLQHERRRRAALGPREEQNHQPFHVNGNFNCDQNPFGM